MHDDVKVELAAALEAEGTQARPDLGWVLRRGRRLRRLRSVAVVMTIVVVVAVAAGSSVLVMGSDDRPVSRPVAPDESREPDRTPPLVEATTEKELAEIFAFRALAAAGLGDPLGARTYTWTYEDDTIAKEGIWSVGFAAADCAPRTAVGGSSQTCRAFGREDPQSGNPYADTFVEVAPTGRGWRVVGVEGNMTDEERARLVGFALDQESEPSHWEFAAVSVWQTTDGPSVTMSPMWIGPYPTDAPGSVCGLRALDEQGRAVGHEIFYVEAPSRPFDRAGWVRGMGVDTDEHIADAEVVCRQYSGRGWEIESGPTMIGEPGAVTGVEASLVWRGDEGFTAAAACRATLVNKAGETVWEGTEGVLQLWRPSELDDYPYRVEVAFSTRGESVDADSIGDLTCETR